MLQRCAAVPAREKEHPMTELSGSAGRARRAGGAAAHRKLVRLRLRNAVSPAILVALVAFWAFSVRTWDIPVDVLPPPSDILYIGRASLRERVLQSVSI